MTLEDYPALKATVREILKDRLMAEFLSGVFDAKAQQLVDVVSDIPLIPGDNFKLSFDYVVQHSDLLSLFEMRGHGQ